MPESELIAFRVHVETLIKAYGLETTARLLDRSPRGVQYWLMENPKKPQKDIVIKVRELFMKHTNGENLLRLFEVESNAEFKEKYIQSLEKEVARLQKNLDLSLGELRHNVLLTRAVAETTQEMVSEFQAGKNKKLLEQILDNASIRNVEKYKKLKEEGNFGYVGK